MANEALRIVRNLSRSGVVLQFQKSAQPLAHHGVIVHDQHSDRFGTRAHLSLLG